MKRLIGVALLVLLVALGGAAWWLYASLDAWVARTVERVGSETLGVAVSVGSVDVDLREGRATLRRLRVANPQGFSSAAAFSLESIRVTLDVGSLGKDPLVLSEIRASAPAVRLETDAKGALNLDVLRRNASQGAPAESAASAEPMRLRIRSLVVEEGQLAGDASQLGGRAVEATLPTLRLSNLQGTPAEIAQTVASGILRQAASTAARAGARSALEKEAEKRLGKGATEAAKGLLRGLTGQGKE